jgi:hypothetical protein
MIAVWVEFVVNEIVRFKRSRGSEEGKKKTKKEREQINRVRWPVESGSWCLLLASDFVWQFTSTLKAWSSHRPLT